MRSLCCGNDLFDRFWDRRLLSWIGSGILFIPIVLCVMFSRRYAFLRYIGYLLCFYLIIRGSGFVHGSREEWREGRPLPNDNSGIKYIPNDVINPPSGASVELASGPYSVRCGVISKSVLGDSSLVEGIFVM